MVSIVSRGATRSLAEALLEVLVQYNADAYRRGGLRRIDELPLIYRPDERQPVITLVAADMLQGQRIVSCGSAAGAWAGWHRAQGRNAHGKLLERDNGMFHAIAIVDGVTWDPATQLRRDARAWM